MPLKGPFRSSSAGDMNTIFYVVDLIFGTRRFDLTTKVLFQAGYQDDTHAGLPFPERATTEESVLGIHGVIDLIFVKDCTYVVDRGGCLKEKNSEAATAREAGE